MAKKKSELSHYPHFFFLVLIFKSISWVIFGSLLLLVGKRFVGTDIVGKIYGTIFGEKENFNQYFFGTGNDEKSALLSYVVYFLIAIVILNIISLLINRNLWKKDGYIENNNFYLHNKWIFILNTLIHIVAAFLLIFSFVSPFTLILALLFITFNSWDLLPRRKELRNPETENFFSWKNQYVRKIIFYSAIVFLVAPFVIVRLRSFYNNANSDSPSGLAKAFQDVLSTSPTLKKVIEMLIGDNFNLDLLYWFIVLWFTKDLIADRWKEFTDFWTKINSIEKRANDFKHHYYYQESWALVNSTPIYLGDYSYLEDNPKFLSHDYLENDLDINDFAQKNQKVIKHIEFYANTIKEPAERNFLTWCLFNEFSSWEDCLRTRRLIKAARK